MAYGKLSTTHAREKALKALKKEPSFASKIKKEEGRLGKLGSKLKDK